jgi:pimeloyl-ACP methyl ester carboxylesterase
MSTGATSGEFVTETFEYDGGRQVTVYVPPAPPEAIVFAGDGQGIAKWGPLRAERTAVFGASAGGELALALGLRHPHVYGAVFCASPGAGYKPPAVMPNPLPRTYLVAGTEEPFFLENAKRWAAALRDADADVVMHERAGSHGGAFWQEEFPLMIAWAFGR